MGTYYIYHLPGKKVGATTDLVRRFTEYRQGGYKGKIEVLETLNCSVMEAGNREWAWADKFGYRRGWHYSSTYAGKLIPRRYKRYHK